MSANSARTVFVVDDDSAIRDSLTMLLGAHGFEPRCFPSAQEFLDLCARGVPDQCVAILDLSMPNMDGLELQAEMEARGIMVPVIFLSGEGDIPAAVTAVQHGAVDFIEKPVDSEVLFDRIEKGFSKQSDWAEDATMQHAVLKQLECLTPREREVLEKLVDGKASKVIAVELGISERTVELHRSRVLKKMDVSNSSQLLTRVLPYWK